jgi:hypothetical protein
LAPAIASGMISGSEKGSVSGLSNVEDHRPPSRREFRPPIDAGFTVAVDRSRPAL